MANFQEKLIRLSYKKISNSSFLRISIAEIEIGIPFPPDKVVNKVFPVCSKSKNTTLPKFNVIKFFSKVSTLINDSQDLQFS